MGNINEAAQRLALASDRAEESHEEALLEGFGRKSSVDFRFDEPTHTYWVNGEKWPGINELFTEFDLIDDTWFTEHGTTRGSSVHMTCALDDLGTISGFDIPKICLPYLEAWRQFKKDSGWVNEIIEKPMFNPSFQFCGTPDRLGKLNGRRHILEIKTGGVHWTVGMQLAAQQMLIDAHLKSQDQTLGDVELSVIQLKPNGKYSLTPIFTFANYNEFVDAANAFLTFNRAYWMRRKNTWKL